MPYGELLLVLMLLVLLQYQETALGTSTVFLKEPAYLPMPVPPSPCNSKSSKMKKYGEVKRRNKDLPLYSLDYHIYLCIIREISDCLTKDEEGVLHLCIRVQDFLLFKTLSAKLKFCSIPIITVTYQCSVCSFFVPFQFALQP